MATLTRGSPLDGGTVQEELRCALCDEAIAPGDGPVRCPVCHLGYHPECWSFAGNKCARLGCTGEIAPTEAVEVRRDAFASPTVALTLRLEEAEIAAAAPQSSPLQSEDLVAGPWATPQLAALAGGLCGLLLDLVFSLTAIALRWEMGEPRFHQIQNLRPLATLNQGSWWLWMLGGALYGMLHRSYLAGRIRTFYPLLRALLAATLLASLSLALGHLMFPLTYRWPALLWGLPATLGWMPPLFSWGLLAASLARALTGYTRPASLFAMVGRTCVLAFAMALDGNATACLHGTIGHSLGWLAGSAANLLLAGHRLDTRIAELGLWLANLGFLVGCAEVLFPKLARQRGA
jgi:hypothetical protein